MVETTPSAARQASVRTHFTSASGQIGLLAEKLAQELGQCWRSGQRLLANDLLGRHPELYDHPEAVIQLICEEVCLRQEHGQAVLASELVGRFPQFRSQIKVMLDCQRLLQAGVEPVFPEVGEHLLDFRLEAVLGQGALGRVYLATQADLADRPVVLKVAPLGGDEHLSLARLQHTHIVPLYQQLQDAEGGLQILCMPFFGGASLDRILKTLRAKPPAQRTGRDLVLALEETNSPLAPPGKAALRAFLERASYVDALTWLGACLADALQYAHERNLIHLDVKPSNVLLAADGQPMLLDFHLAIAPLQAGSRPPVWFGGTSGYMSPEQQRVFEAMKDGQPVAERVDASSDIYALGVLLHECLAGQEAPPLRRGNASVSVGLSDIIARCLRPERGQRYPSAGALAADLRRQLAHQPLLEAPNRSLTERWRKWRRRRPYALILGLLSGLVVLAAVSAGFLLWGRHLQTADQAEQALVEGRDLRAQGRPADAVRAFTRGLEAAQSLTGRQDLRDRLNSERHAARQDHLQHNCQALLDRIRFDFDSDALSPPAVRQLADACRALSKAADELKSDVAADRLELAILWSDLVVRSAVDQQAARTEALRILAEAKKRWGASVVLDHERRRHTAALGLQDPPSASTETRPRSAWEHYALGRSLLRGGQLPEAAQHLEQAVALQPQGFWPNFHQGVCAHRRGQHAEAVAAFRVCIALAPEQPGCWFNRAQAHQAKGDTALALFDYERALRLDPTMSAAWLNRGLLHMNEKRLDLAVADLEQALKTGRDPALAHYNLALAHQARGDLTRASAHVRQALAQRPNFTQARELQSRLP